MHFNPFTPKSDLVDFTLSNARQFYSSKGDRLGVKGLSYFGKDHCDKTEVPDPLAVDLISYKLTSRQKLSRLITQYRNIFSNILEGTAVLLQGVIGKFIPILVDLPC